MKDTNSTVQTVLTNIARQDLADRKIDLWPKLRESLSGRASFPQRGFALSPVRTVILAGLTIGLVVGYFGYILFPGKQVLAEAFQRLFRPITAEQVPTMASEVTAPTAVPTFAVALTAVEPTATPEPVGEVGGALPETCGTDPWGYTCQVARAERRAGFDALEFPADPQAFVFAHVLEARPGSIILDYNLIGGGGYLTFTQGIGEPNYRSYGAEESAIQDVMVGKNHGEYVEGTWTIGEGETAFSWNPCCRQRLRWQDGERWFELDKTASMPQVAYMTREVMIDMALNLVSQPEPGTQPRLEYLSLEEVPQVVPFDVLLPGLLPENFSFKYGSYDPQKQELRLHYYFRGDMSSGGAEMTIYETLSDDIFAREPAGEPVTINDIPGFYTTGGPFNHAVRWTDGQTRVILALTSNENLGGATFTREQVIEIAGSMK